MDRPSTSKPRGVCRYYLDPRGCFAGKKCKFLHGQPDTVKITPFDEAKICRHFAKGYCKRGDKCWFRHVGVASTSQSPEVTIDSVDDLCGICLEKPVTFGLLGGCSHIFCVECIKQWRDPTGKSDSLVSGAIKKCPMCRAPSRFITPSSIFHPHGRPEKEAIVNAYRDSMARVECKYFKESRMKTSRPSCPFGKDCFYKHLNGDGTPFVFPDGVDVCMRRHRIRSRPRRDFLDDFLLGDISATIDAVRAEFMRAQQNETLMNTSAMDELWGDAHPMAFPFPRDETQRSQEGLLFLQDLILSFRGLQGSRPDEDLPPPLEPIDVPNLAPAQASPRPNSPLNRDADDNASNGSMPPLENVMSSDSEYEDSSDEESPSRGGLRPLDSLDVAGPSTATPDLQILLATAPRDPESDDALSSDDEEQKADETPENDSDDAPPFVTDGRGRVIGAGEERSLLSRVLGAFFPT